MNKGFLDILCCPSCRGELRIEAESAVRGDDIESGSLRCVSCGTAYPIIRSIPRFVPAENYAGSFGFQWNRFPRTQLDSNSGHPITRKRFFAQHEWSADEMRGKRVLDVGCGSGRFAEIAISTGARVVAMDYSAAIDAARANLAGRGDIDFVQGDVYRMPFRDGVFDYVYCFGVIQHTPDPRQAFLSLLGPLRAGGKVAIDVYPKTWMNLIWWKYWLRPFLKRIPPEKLFPLVERMVKRFLPLSRAIGRIPVIGRRLRWLLPVMNYEGSLPLSKEQLYEWSVLDTFDMYSPAHDHPKSVRDLRGWLADASLAKGEVVNMGLVVLRGTK
jgi:ubiquinone/menaquinone biosynthesis C-methylase UbiE/uncharacterized protein YbaR (Trm112 family)